MTSDDDDVRRRIGSCTPSVDSKDDAGTTTGSSGCACDISERAPTTPWLALFPLALAALVRAARRRLG